jgi:hypothetical protein
MEAGSEAELDSYITALQLQLIDNEEFISSLPARASAQWALVLRQHDMHLALEDAMEQRRGRLVGREARDLGNRDDTTLELVRDGTGYEKDSRPVLIKIGMTIELSPEKNGDLSDDTTEVQPAVKYECISCYDTFDQRLIITCPCEHRYCQECITKVFESSIVRGGNYPPQCCKKPIPIEVAQASLTDMIIKKYHTRKFEVEVRYNLISS